MKGKWLNIITKISFLLLLVGFAVLSVAAKVKRDNLQPKDVKISINHNDGYFFITKKEVLVKLNDIISDSSRIKNIYNLNILKSKVEENPFVKDVDVFVDHNNHVNISINQRKPLFRVVNEQNISYYVDADGYKFPLSNHAFPKVLIVSGNIPDNSLLSGKIESAKLKRIYDWVKHMSEDEYWTSMIAQIYIDAEGKTELITRVGNYQVLVDDKLEPADQLEKLQIFLEEIAQNQGWEKYKKINVQFDGQIICSK